MKFRANLAAPAMIMAFLAVFGVSAQKIQYQSAPGTELSKYKTYQWQRANDATYPEKTIDQMFVRAIDSELSKKGLLRTDTDDADLIVIYQIAVLGDVEWSAGHSTIPFIGEGSIIGAPVAGTHIMQKGSFILDLYDGKNKKQIWQAHAVKTLDDSSDLAKKGKNISKAMAKIFKNYPSRVK